MNTQKNLGKALVTGASSGIGAYYADRLAKRGYDLILVARDEDRLNELARRLKAETGRQVEVKRADLTKHADIASVEQILRSDSAITLLVNNAGSAVVGNLADSDPEKLESMITLNVTALTLLSRAFAPALIHRKGGAIINIASVVALAPGMVGGTYSATKAYVLNFSQALQKELSEHGAYVQAVLPGATKTELWERGGVDIESFPKEIVMSTQDLVDASLVGFDRRETVTIPPLQDVKQWDALETARAALEPNLSWAKPAVRYSAR